MIFLYTSTCTFFVHNKLSWRMYNFTSAWACMHGYVHNTPSTHAWCTPLMYSHCTWAIIIKYMYMYLTNLRNTCCRHVAPESVQHDWRTKLKASNYLGSLTRYSEVTEFSPVMDKEKEERRKRSNLAIGFNHGNIMYSVDGSEMYLFIIYLFLLLF